MQKKKLMTTKIRSSPSIHGLEAANTKYLFQLEYPKQQLRWMLRSGEEIEPAGMNN